MGSGPSRAFYSLGEFPTEGQVSGMIPVTRKMHEFLSFVEFLVHCSGLALRLGVFCLMMVTRIEREPRVARGLYESSRAVTQVDGLPRAPSLLIAQFSMRRLTLTSESHSSDS